MRLKSEGYVKEVKYENGERMKCKEITVKGKE